MNIFCPTRLKKAITVVALSFSLGVVTVQTHTLFAQNSLVTDAALELQAGSERSDMPSLERAITKAKQALDKPELLKPKQIAKCHTVLGRAYLELLRLAQQKEDQATLKKYPHLGEQAYDEFSKAVKIDPDAKEYYLNYRQALAISLVNEARDYIFDANHAKALEATEKAEGIYAELLAKDGKPGKAPYNIFILKGTIQVMKKTAADSLAAISSFESARVGFDETISNMEKEKDPLIKKQLQKAMEQIKKDPTVPMIFSNLIILYAKSKKDFKAAMDIAKVGKEKFPDDEAIKNAEMQLYLEPEMFNQALTKFEADVAQNPKNIQACLILADLLEKKAIAEEKKQANNPEAQKSLARAIELYKQVLSNDPKNFNANFNLGALYNNQAVKFNDLIKDLESDLSKNEEYEKAKKDRDEQLTNAMNSFVKAHEADPNSTQALDALINVTAALSKLEDREMYKKKREALQNK